MRINQQAKAVRCDQCGTTAPVHGNICKSLDHALDHAGWYHYAYQPDLYATRDLLLCPRCKLEFEVSEDGKGAE